MVRATHEWIEDNNHTPYLMVDAMGEGVEVPQQYVKDGRIVLNVSTSAVRGLSITAEGVMFSARFNTIPHDIWVPVHAILGIFSQQNGLGLYFEESGDIVPPTPPGSGTGKAPSEKLSSVAKKDTSKKPNKAGLRVIK